MSFFLVLGTAAQSGSEYLTITHGGTSDVWKYYPVGRVSPAHILQAASTQAGATAGIGTDKKLTFSFGGASMRLDMSTAALATYLGFDAHAPAAIGTAITANNALTAVECVSVDPSLSYQFAGAAGHGKASAGLQTVSGQITALINPAELSTFLGAIIQGAYVTPCDTVRGLFPWTLAITAINSEIVTTAPGGTFATDARYRLQLIGTVQP